MADFKTIQKALLIVQEKHQDFFIAHGTIITDYVIITDIDLVPVKFINNLPDYIIADVINAIIEK